MPTYDIYHDGTYANASYINGMGGYNMPGSTHQNNTNNTNQRYPVDLTNKWPSTFFNAGTPPTLKTGTKISSDLMKQLRQNARAIIENFNDATITGTKIDLSSIVTFNSGDTPDMACVALSSTAFVVAYRDSGNNAYGTAIVGTISGTTITYGSEYVFNSGNTSDISMAALSSTAIVIAYRDQGNSNYGTAIVGTISGTTITYGSEYVFNSRNTQYTSIAAVSSTKIVISYNDYDNYQSGTAIVGVISGTTITFYTAYIYEQYTSTVSGNVTNNSCIKLTATTFLVCYRNYTSLSAGYSGWAVIGSITDGNLITPGTKVPFNNTGCNYISAGLIGTSYFIIAYRDMLDGYGRAIIGSFAGSAITLGALNNIYTFSATSTSNISCTVLSSTLVALSFKGSSSHGYGVIGKITSNTVLTFGIPQKFIASVIDTTSSIPVTSTSFLTAFNISTTNGRSIIMSIGLDDYKVAPRPTFSAIPDSTINSPNKITAANFNQTDGSIDPANSALLDDIKEGYRPYSGTGVSAGTIITKAKIDEIVSQLYSANQYANYLNHTNTGSTIRPDDYWNHSESYNQTSRSWFCHRNNNHYNSNGLNKYDDYSKSYATPTHTNSPTNPAPYSDGLGET